MNIQGLTKTTLLDYPGKVAATVFVAGCNMRCRFCHNYELVLGKGDSSISEQDIYDFLKKRNRVLEGVCISGGEPTLQEDLQGFLGRIKELGFKVKLDTNGLKPQVVEILLENALVDMVALDIKSSPGGYEKLCGVSEAKALLVRDTLKIMHRFNVPVQLRTTVCGFVHTEQDFYKIGEWLKDFDYPYFLQSFKSSEFVPDKDILEPQMTELQCYAEILRQYFSDVQIR